jgi:hypothetical protein
MEQSHCLELVVGAPALFTSIFLRYIFFILQAFLSSHFSVWFHCTSVVYSMERINGLLLENIICTISYVSVLRTIGNFPRRTPVREMHLAFKLPYVYDYITKYAGSKQKSY